MLDNTNEDTYTIVKEWDNLPSKRSLRTSLLDTPSFRAPLDSPKTMPEPVNNNGPEELRL